MKLYYSKGACSIAVRIILHEIGVKCEYEGVDLKTKKTEKGTDFLTINPKGSVPALEINNKEILTENAVIQQYLAEQNGATQLLPDKDNFQRYRVLEWLNFITTELHKVVAPLFNPSLPTEYKDRFIKPTFKSKLDHVDQYLKNKDYLVGDHFTLADSYLFVILFWLPHFQMDLSTWENLKRYFDQIKKRKSVQKSLEEEGFTV